MKRRRSDRSTSKSFRRGRGLIIPLPPKRVELSLHRVARGAVPSFLRVIMIFSRPVRSFLFMKKSLIIISFVVVIMAGVWLFRQPFLDWRWNVSQPELPMAEVIEDKNDQEDKEVAEEEIPKL